MDSTPRTFFMGLKAPSFLLLRTGLDLRSSVPCEHTDSESAICSSPAWALIGSKSRSFTQQTKGGWFFDSGQSALGLWPMTRTAGSPSLQRSPRHASQFIERFQTKSSWSRASNEMRRSGLPCFVEVVPSSGRGPRACGGLSDRDSASLKWRLITLSGKLFMQVKRVLKRVVVGPSFYSFVR